MGYHYFYDHGYVPNGLFWVDPETIAPRYRARLIALMQDLARLRTDEAVWQLRGIFVRLGFEMEPEFSGMPEDETDLRATYMNSLPAWFIRAPEEDLGDWHYTAHVGSGPLDAPLSMTFFVTLL